ncbi:hypothetical protein JJB97_10420 [Enterobacterales bacterium BIT-L3]|uniref:Mercuric transport protein MerT n=2 Tax=Tenebrionibacter/Tenebrionicola group TaxID=2969848 RepID=A0A8K0V7N2_9ENTR|nr:hypothetical protein [Tenebrionibacter intestinalis]MBV5096317.1 hypothetical protein [Tenebrionicola larvae]
MAQNSAKGPLITLAAALASSFYCIGPLLYLLFGLSAAGLTNLPALAWLQMPLIALAAGMMAREFWRIYLSPRPLCLNAISLRMLRALYWLALPLIITLAT